MQIPRLPRTTCHALIALLAVLSAAAVAQSNFRPEVGQPGKDVIWVPTSDRLVERMLRMAKVGPSDYVIDLGSGDGRIVIAAAKQFGARAKGYEFNPDMVALARSNAAREGVSDRAEFARGDLYEADLSPATVVTMYLLPSINLKLRPKLLKLKPGTRIVSHDFDMGDWRPEETSSNDGGGTAYFWIVPAQVDGPWQVEYETPVAKQRMELTFKQEFQMLDGRAVRGERLSPASGELNGDGIRFKVSDGDKGELVFVGRVKGAAMDGTVRLLDGTQHPFTAMR
jgi:hypothetical protein